MNRKFNIWGREFDLQVMFGNFADNEAKPVQKEALKTFLANLHLIDECKSEVENYCLRKNAKEIGANTIDNIFKYVIPEALYIENTHDNTHCVALVCAYKFDEENGIAVIFKNEAFCQVTTQSVL